MHTYTRTLCLHAVLPNYLLQLFISSIHFGLVWVVWGGVGVAMGKENERGEKGI